MVVAGRRRAASTYDCERDDRLCSAGASGAGVVVPRSFAREPQVVVLAAVLAAVLTALPARLDGRFGSTS